MKKVKEAREESSKERMLLLFELRKEMGDNRTNGGNKYDKTLTRKLYKSFAATYPQLPWNKDWKMRYLNYMSTQDVEELSCIWISIELNPVEGENMWQS